MTTPSHVQVSPDSTGKDIDAQQLTSTEAGNPTVLRQTVTVGDPNTYGNVVGVNADGGQQVGGTVVEGTAVTAPFPVLVAGQDNVSTNRALLTDSQGTLFVLHRYEVFDEILNELKKLTIGISMLVGEDLTNEDMDK